MYIINARVKAKLAIPPRDTMHRSELAEKDTAFGPNRGPSPPILPGLVRNYGHPRRQTREMTRPPHHNRDYGRAISDTFFSSGWSDWRWAGRDFARIARKSRTNHWELEGPSFWTIIAPNAIPLSGRFPARYRIA